MGAYPVATEPRKVGIFTLTHALNYGAFYQMYAMAKYFESIGYDVTVFNCQRTLKYRLMQVFSYNPLRQFRKLILRHRYNKDRATIRVVPYRGQPLDLAILGSDEIWNLDNASFEHAPEYVGLNINASKIIAYAPSIGFATPANLIENETFRHGLSSIDKILARDKETQAVAEKVTGQQIPQVVDPTILMGEWSDFLGDAPKTEEDYILYYGYTSTPAFKEALIAFARSRNLKIYTAGFRTHDWCDKNFACGPRDFLGLMVNATYVFTNTFHGFVMATLLDKPLCYAAPAQKIRDIAEKISIDDDVLTSTSGSAEIEAALGRDRTERNLRISELRTQSRRELTTLIDTAHPTTTGC
jgi:hypothetical protein